MVYSRTEILQKEVFVIDCLDKVPKEKLMHLKAVVFCRCTEENIRLITNQIQNPTFSSYSLCKSHLQSHLVFSNTVDREVLGTLAKADSQAHNVV